MDGSGWLAVGSGRWVVGGAWVRGNSPRTDAEKPAFLVTDSRGAAAMSAGECLRENEPVPRVPGRIYDPSTTPLQPSHTVVPQPKSWPRGVQLASWDAAAVRRA